MINFKFSIIVFTLFMCNYVHSQDYLITKQWIDQTNMDDSKVDGIIYIKKGKDFLVDRLFLDNKTLNLNRINSLNGADKLEKATALLEKLNGGTIVISDNIVIDRPVTIRNIRGLEIRGITSRYSLQGGLFTSSAIEFVKDGSLTFTDFIDLKIIKINLLNKTKQHENLLKLYKGHGFEISDVNIRSVNSNRSVGIYLGNNSGAEASFMGTISRVNILSDGGTGIYTGDSNTSLNFTNCYFMGCSWQIKGTVYSSWTNCAVDNSPDNAYNISGGKYSKAHTLTFISCGAEKSQKSAWYFESGVYSVEIIAPLSGINNISKASNVGELATFNNIGTNQLTNIKISSPVVMVNDNNWDIYVTNGKTGKITIENIYSEAFTNKIGSKDWEISKNLIVK